MLEYLDIEERLFAYNKLEAIKISNLLQDDGWVWSYRPTTLVVFIYNWISKLQGNKTADSRPNDLTLF